MKPSTLARHIFRRPAMRPEVAAALQSGDVARIAAVVGAREVTWSADGGRIREDWCNCAPMAPASAWVRFDRWTAQGCTGHGYGCPKCRRIVQAGETPRGGAPAPSFALVHRGRSTAHA